MLHAAAPGVQRGGARRLQDEIWGAPLGLALGSGPLARRPLALGVGFGAVVWRTSVAPPSMQHLIPSGLLDTALDRTVVVGYGNVGLELRRHLPGWPADPPPMDGRVALVTGAAAGLGRAAAIGFARLGARVHVHARSAQRAADALAAVRAEVPDADLVAEDCDVSDLAALRTFCADMADRLDRLDVLVHNAGVMPARRTRTPDGHELMFATHVLATFGLTAGLAETLRRSAPARVINVSSGGMYGQPLPPARDPESDAADYRPATLYAATKRQQVVITELWARRLDGSGVVVHAMHPGWADTGGVAAALPRFHAVARPILRTAAQGADTIVWLGAAPAPLRSTGRFWHDRRPRPTHYLIGPRTESEADRAALWSYVESSVQNLATPPASP